VKLPEDSHIALEKLTRYLLVPQARGDKSAYLALAGYTLANFTTLLTHLRGQILTQEATPLEKTIYGQLYEIRAQLIGPSGRALGVRTIWMTEYLSGATKFITLIPDKES
jgi:hypothetical protein